MRDYYEILGLSKNASQNEIKTAYRKLSKKFHPDVNDGDKFFEERFKEIQEAYDYLIDEIKRKKYDESFNLNTESFQQTKKTEKYGQEKPTTQSQTEESDHFKEKSKGKFQEKRKEKKNKAKLIIIILILLISISLFFYFSETKKTTPDLSGIKVDLDVQRFDEDFFSIDTLTLEKGISALQAKYHDFVPIFFQNILGVTDSDGVKTYYRLYKPVFDSSQKLYKDFEPVKRQVEQALRFVKYYFPSYRLPARITTIVGPMNSMQDFAMMANGEYTPDFLGTDFIGISLQFYLGKDFSLYNTGYFINNVAPAYRSRRLSREYIISDVMKLITEDIFPDKSKGKPLVEQMIEKGKHWWMLDKFLPGDPDSIKTGYTKQQLTWCKENEGLIWSYIVKNEDINTINPSTIQTYIGEAPFTQGFSQELSPGNIGQWIGWQIVKKFADNNPKLKPEEVMHTEPRTILEAAKYKPK